jgi:hypothetical protein
MYYSVRKYIQGPAEIPDDFQNSCDWNRLRWEFVLERSSSETQSISVAMERWSVEHRAFAVETIFKNNDSVLTQRIFRLHFNIYQNDSVRSGSTSSSEDISRARCTKRNQEQNNREEVAAISPNMLQRVMQNFQKLLGECVDNKGRHHTDTIFSK